MKIFGKRDSLPFIFTCFPGLGIQQQQLLILGKLAKINQPTISLDMFYVKTCSEHKNTDLQTFFIASLMVVFSAIEAKNILMASSRMSLGRSDSTSTKVNIRMTKNICICFGFYTLEEQNNVTDKKEIRKLKDRMFLWL